MTKKSRLMGTKLFSIFCLVVCIALSFSLADLFSNIITSQAFSSTTNKIKSSAFTLYAIKLYSTTTQSQANDLSQSAQQKNCAGYVFQSDTEYMVLASAYENKADAEKVETNLKSSNISCSIITLDFANLEFPINTTGNEKTALENAVCVYKNLYKKLYDLSVSVDTNLSTEIESKLGLSEIISYFTKIKADFEGVFNSKITTELLELKLSLMNVDNILEKLANFSDSKIPFSSAIKHTYFEILIEQQKLYEKL